MLARFWGVRGSTPTPQSENMRYGGNTSCIELRTNSDEILILDGGTGIRRLGARLENEFGGRSIRGHIFFSHFHLDHIQGIPFFSPLYNSRNHFTFYFADRRDTQLMLDAVGGIMASPYFPVDMSNLPCKRDYVRLVEGRLQVANTTIDVLPLNHPQGSFGFRVMQNGKALTYCTDVELGLDWSDANVRKLAQDAEVFIVDAQYTPEELQAHKGWGHSSWKQAVDIGKDANAKQIALFHYNPDHGDEEIEQMIQQAKKHHPNVIATREGLELTV
jgi:phosphoribosyl 1,2-cyclic phosphodiesterase